MSRREYDLAPSAGRDVSALLTRTAVGQGLRLLRSLIILPLLPPAALGAYRLFTVSLQYLGMLDLGLFGTASVRYPEAEAAGDQERCASYHRLTWQISLIGGTLSLAAIAVLLIQTRAIEPAVVAVIAVLGSTHLANRFVDVMYTSRREFREAARNELISGTIGFLIAVGGTLRFGIEGLLVGTVATPAISVFMGRKLAFPAGWTRVDRPFWRSQLPPALRLWVSSFALEASVSADVLMLGWVLGATDERYGYYAFGTVLAGLAGLATMSLVRVQVVHLSRVAGMTSIRDQAVKEQMDHSLLRDCVGTIWSSSAIAVALAVVPWFLPKYTPSLPILGMFLSAAVLRRWIKYARHMLIMAERNRWATAAAGVGAATMCGYIAIVHALGDNLIAFAAASLVGPLVGGALILACAYWVLEFRGFGVFLVKLLIAHSPLVLFGLTWLIPHPLAVPVSGVAVGVASLITFRITFPGAVSDTAQLLFGGFVRRWKRQPDAAP